ncbi:MAG: tungstate ABC transporter substrate-binding protein WtpA [Thermodesulfobacteriota bacterium]|nr:tungstate ABC transporter substrate-binding protein WtpA [Thermodesulfobacteriota bacterium]
MKKVRLAQGVFWIVVGIALILSISQANAEPTGKVIVFHAGSLTVPFAKMEKIFEARYPKVDVLRKGGGSTKMARMISELHKPADIMASADFAVIDKILIPDNADYNIRFASNQLVLCYTEKSLFAKEVNADNWYRILGRKGLVWGHSDPNLDPCGYRSLMVIQLAEKYYDVPGLYDQLISNRPKRNVRPKSVELLSLLKTGNMDYAWEYLSVAVQHHLKYIELPDEINLGNYKMDGFYKKAQVKVTGKKPGVWIYRTGRSCTYGITILKGSRNPEAAEAFLGYLLNPNGGLNILKEMGQPPLIPCQVPTEKMKSQLAVSLQKWVVVRD